MKIRKNLQEMATKKNKQKHSAITHLTRPGSNIYNDKGWNSILKAVNKSFTSGLSTDFSFIFWQDQNSKKFDLLSVIGKSKKTLKGALDKKLIPAKWTKKNGYNTLFSSAGKTSSAVPRLIKALRKNDSDTILVPIC